MCCRPALCLLLLVPLLSACKALHPVKLVSLLGKQQEIVAFEDKEAVSSQKTHYVSLAPYRKLCSATGKTSYIVFVQNRGSSTIDFGPENVSIEFIENLNSQVPKNIRLQSYNDLLQEIQIKERNTKLSQSWAAVGVASAVGPLNNMPTEITEPNHNSNRALTSNKLIPESTTTESDLKAKDTKFRSQIYDTAKKANSKKEILDTIIMTQQKLSPGEHYGGLIVSDTRKMDGQDEGVFRMKISVDGEVHYFSVARRLQKATQKSEQLLASK